MKVTVQSITANWLKANGYDGLCSDECGCGLDDLAPCDGAVMKCGPAYRWECAKCREPGETCEYREHNAGCWRSTEQEQ